MDKETGDDRKILPAAHYLGHRERLRDRFRNHGQELLQDYEFLELISVFRD